MTVVTGTPDDDVIRTAVLGGSLVGLPDATESDDLIDAAEGNDMIAAVGGARQVRLLAQGGDGDDRIVGGDRDDRIDGGANDDTLSGLGGNDLLIGGDGADTILGGAHGGSFRILGSGLAARVVVNRGDVIDLRGASGGGDRAADTVLYNLAGTSTPGDGVDTILGFESGLDELGIFLGAATPLIRAFSNGRW